VRENPPSYEQLERKTEEIPHWACWNRMYCRLGLNAMIRMVLNAMIINSRVQYEYSRRGNSALSMLEQKVLSNGAECNGYHASSMNTADWACGCSNDNILLATQISALIVRYIPERTMWMHQLLK
jgi:hypothetical protein